MFSWIPIHRETIGRILGYRQNQEELLTILREMKQQGLTVISLEDKDGQGKAIPLAEIDPFTFLASFNRGVTQDNRRENWTFLKARWSLQSPVPLDFTGIPTLNNMKSWLFPYAANRNRDHMENLWLVASQAAEGGIEQVDESLFNRCLDLDCVGISILTICMFWINPQKFLPADSKTTTYAKAKGIPIKPKDYQSYRQWLKEMTEQLGDNYPQVSNEAHLFAVQGKKWGFTRWMGPLLDALRALGGSSKPKDVLQKIQQVTKVPDAILIEKLASGQTRFYNEAHWARMYLIWEGLV